MTKTPDFNSDFWKKRYLLIDSRKLISGKDSIFFAIKGPRHNGHLYIHELYKKGVRSFVVSELEKTWEDNLPDAKFFRSDNTVLTLQQLVAFHRNKFRIPVIGITGSNGKTIVKEWLFQFFETEFRTVKSPKSYNSQVGVPLSVWEMTSFHNLGIFEAGISQTGEMENLEKIIQPTIGLLTNIGTAHDAGFKNKQEKIDEKIKLFANCQTLIYCCDDPQIDQSMAKLSGEKYPWSFQNKGYFNFQLKAADHSQLTLQKQGKDYQFDLPFSDKASIENLVHCIVMLSYKGYSSEIIQDKINSLANVPMRLELKRGINNCLVIDDTYNNDLAGLEVALNFMDQQDDKRKRTVILSDFGDSSKVNYQDLLTLLSNKKIKRILGIGKEISSIKNEFEHFETNFFQHIETFIKAFPTLKFENESILVKGARVFAFEKIVQQLSLKLHGTRLEINLEAIVHNLNFYRSLLKPETKIMVMVKALAYGSGEFEIPRLLQYQKVDYLGVAYVDEGVRLRENGIRIPIMVMNPAQESFYQIIKYNLEPEIYNLNLLNQFIQFLNSSEEPDNPVGIHLKIDTGMHRLGFESDEIEKVIQTLKNNSKIKVRGILTHLAGADEDKHNEFSLKQLNSFKTIATKIEKSLHISCIKYALNSAGIIKFPDYQMDMVRLGIGLYGVEVNQKLQENLKNTGTLKTTISQIKKIKKGETIGYGRHGKAEKDIKIATIAIGYADGYDRRFSKGIGKVLINGKIAKVIGNVCMDMTMVEITGINAKEGDEVIIFGQDLPIWKLAQNIGTIPYEILTNVNERVKRIYFEE
ncbi:bifunctional UDP-N-acetylmuramoyl-tripeptide:D-alanyl-D-alanine ligase/alanine racemase [Flexithrix dorotheae]|uniref:bifunctional UDP-N-acetylmuramoyl-tripeptide:D-alanyl-D-alanine ligase/alanine racemase n=1 Tax=Flexithrix dorotheae TaxID=70993 RepID=UPI00036B4D3A|nr:bifunctional UDP-N-acetylmuramoyl-tripeptide:D-alanyl-D-alanine ligase/alanine racemase [Flexithrix dorotheae]